MHEKKWMKQNKTIQLGIMNQKQSRDLVIALPVTKAVLSATEILVWMVLSVKSITLVGKNPKSHKHTPPPYENMFPCRTSSAEYWRWVTVSFWGEVIYFWHCIIRTCIQLSMEVKESELTLGIQALWVALWHTCKF